MGVHREFLRERSKCFAGSKIFEVHIRFLSGDYNEDAKKTELLKVSIF